MPDADVATMTGKTCLITGGTGGIGATIACELARRGARVVIVGRDPERTSARAEEIRRDTGNHSVEHLCADLSSQDAVRGLARAFLARHERLDVLILNAGAIFELRQESVDGIEMTLALNHLGHFLLTNLVLGALRGAAPSRIVVVSSSAHKDIPGFDFADPEAKARAAWRGAYPTTRSASAFYSFAKPWAHPAFLQYAHTKLANLLFMHELSNRLAGSRVTCNALHPGLVATNFASGAGIYTWFMRQQARLFGVSASQGARTPVYLATSPEVADTTGRYFVNETIAESSEPSRDPQAARRLWELSEQMTGLRS